MVRADLTVGSFVFIVLKTYSADLSIYATFGKFASICVFGLVVPLCLNIQLSSIISILFTKTEVLIWHFTMFYGSCVLDCFWTDVVSVPPLIYLNLNPNQNL